MTSPSRIILAEDNPADVGLVREALREHNIQCDLRVLSDGQQVVAFIDQLDADTSIPCPDLLLLDLSLPKYNGNHVLRYLRSSERCGRTPVVIMSSSDWPADREAARKNAALHFFRKPSSLDQFLQLGTIVKDVIGGA